MLLIDETSRRPALGSSAIEVMPRGRLSVSSGTGGRHEPSRRAAGPALVAGVAAEPELPVVDAAGVDDEAVADWADPDASSMRESHTWGGSEGWGALDGSLGEGRTEPYMSIA